VVDLLLRALHRAKSPEFPRLLGSRFLRVFCMALFSLVTWRAGLGLTEFRCWASYAA
jgi:hypothetical protein